MLGLSPGLLIVGFDVIGGVFAMDGGALGGSERGAVCYFAPDSLRWEPLDVPCSAWLRWLLTEPEEVERFYENARREGWRAEVRGVQIDDAIHTAPPQWTSEGKDLARVSRRVIAAREVVEVAFAAARERGGHDVPGPRWDPER